MIKYHDLIMTIDVQYSIKIDNIQQLIMKKKQQIMTSRYMFEKLIIELR